MMFIYNKKLYNFSYMQIYYFIIIPLIYICAFFFNGEVLLCDGGGSGSNQGFEYRVNGWGGELDGRPITGGWFKFPRNT